MGFKVGIVGAGQFSKCFIPLFQAHPFVDEVVLADIHPERCNKYAAAFGLERTFSSLDELLLSDVDAVAIFTQRHLHGEHTLKALKAGKHVYCAVPMAQSQEEISLILEEIKRSRLIYMTGETSYYYPSTVLCRDRYNAGHLGKFVYGEAQYLHDMLHGFYDAFKHSGGADWKKVAGIPPMYYPTHSASMILSVTGAKSTHVSCLGFVDQHEDGIFKKGGNLWDNPFSNQSALVRTSDGGIMRLNEFRRVGWGGKNSVYMSMFGTSGSYEEHAGGSAWSNLKWGEVENLTPELQCKDQYVQLSEGESTHHVLEHDFNASLAKVHHSYRLPDSFEGMPNGHHGSHQFLVDDFMKAVRTNKLPPNHAWRAADYMMPGLIAHESSLRNGEMLEVPDHGEAPSGWDLLDPDSFVAYPY
ncbi:Gfo/Idh/MocA family protein [Paenibacillus roseipurpureus]|uniref:Gfo/Idh/MocA family oxidoreductase n=1 Tax=Paenibacillus roseopurpureus TaxID=2918901 RepID=A0AA96LRR4_9BACL|nr:Gfo/Idh/MocA family oxidoreductase [Paenibacillus sp. MBLB1832]WNR46032.1 Gfo/Idh/MocA family oxidoreductase [Paenibacillus sp. MBLB1832]